MVKLRSHKPRPRRPRWFTSRLGRPSPWEVVQIPEAHVPAWIDGVCSMWQDTATQPIMEALWKRMQTIEGRLQHQFSGRDWSKVTSWQLVEWIDAALGVHLGVDAFLPPPLDGLPLTVRRFLYVHVFLFKAGAQLDEDQKEDFGAKTIGKLSPEDRILAVALRPIWYATAAPFLAEEFERRARRHIGTEAGILLLIMGALRLTPGDQSDLLERDAVATVKSLTKIVGSMKVRPQERPEIPSQVPITLGERWGQLEPIESLVRALEGELDIAPRAVRDDLEDQGRRRERFEVLFRESDEDSEADELLSDEASPLDNLRMRELLGRLGASPRMKQLVVAFLEDPGRQVDLARRLGVTDKTIRNWNKELKNILDE